MDLDHGHDRVKDVFLEACLRPPAARQAYLSEACAGSDELLREVQSLLSFHQRSHSESAPGQAVRRRPRARFRRQQVVGGGRFRIERMLGRGGMGEVYAAFDLVLGVPVALKTLNARGDAHRGRLLEEVRLARQVSHPGICRVYDIGEHAGTPFLTMELILGEDLATRLRRTGPWSSREIVSLGASLGDALAAAHEAGILHRDLKPGNLLIDSRGGLHVSDFGIASLSKSASTGDGDNGPRGTLAYMAPEALDRHPELTEQSDLYSMGVVLYELATGAPVFQAPDASLLRELHRSKDPEPPSRRRPGIDDGLEAWILRLLARDPAARPASARAVADGLRSLRTESGREPGVAAAEQRPLVALLCEIDPARVVESSQDRELVGILQARWAGICVENGGRVARRLERGLLVHFGVARASEYDVETAVRAGFDILDAAARTAPGATDRVRAAVSINAGTAVVRSARDGSAAVSGAVDDVEALRRLLAPDTVVVSAEALPLLRDAVAARTLVIATPGTGAGAGAAVHHNPRREARIEARRPGQTPFAGRALELAQLLARWEDAKAGRGQAVLLSGEAGVGKSRLIQELWGRIAGEAEGLEVQCRGFYRSSPLAPFLDLLRRSADIADADGQEARSRKLAALLGPLGKLGAEIHSTMEGWLVPAAAAASVIDSTGHGAVANPKRFRRALADWLFALAEEKPLLLVIDDLHWSDPTSLEAIDLLVDECGAARLLLIVATRPVGSVRWTGPQTSTIALQGLRPDEARSLAAVVGTGPALASGALDRVVESAAGNPLFLEELVRHAREIGDAGSLSDTGLGGVPLTIKSLLQTRLDTLGSAKRIAQAAAVCGRSSRHDVLEAMVASERGIDLVEDLERLHAAKVVHQRGVPPSAVYTFRNPLLADAAYASMPVRRRRAIHAKVAELMPTLDAEGAIARPEVIASHWMLAGQPARAFPWWRQAGLLALQRSAFAEAASDFEHARQAFRPWARAQAIDSPEAELELLVGSTSAQFGQRFLPTELRPAFSRMRSLCKRLKSGETVALALFSQLRFKLLAQERKGIFALLRRCIAVAEKTGERRLIAAVSAQASLILTHEGRYAEAEPYIHRCLSLDAPGVPWAMVVDPRVNVAYARSMALWARGRTTELRRSAEEATREADRIGHSLSRAYGRVVQGIPLLLAGARDEASRSIRQGLELATDGEPAVVVAIGRLLEAVVESALGRASAERLEPAIAAWEASGQVQFLGVSRLYLADALEREGRPEEAVALLEQECGRSAQQLAGYVAPELHRRRGELLARLRRSVEAEAALRHALRLARESGAHAPALRASASLGRLLASRYAVGATRVLEQSLAGLEPEVDATERGDAEALLAELRERAPRLRRGAA